MHVRRFTRPVATRHGLGTVGSAVAISLLVASLGGCFLMPNLAPKATVVVAPQAGHAPLTVRLDATGSSDSDGIIVAYIWTIDGAIPENGPTAEHTFSEPGTHTVRLILRDDDGAESVTNVDVRVDPPNAPPSAIFTLAPAAGAVGETVWFDGAASVDADGSIVSFRWDFGDGTYGGGERASHVYTTEGTYTVVLTVTDDDGTSSDVSRFVLVAGNGQGPIATFTPSQASVDVGASVQFDGSSSHSTGGTVVGYSWAFGDGASGSGPVVSHTYTSAGTYTVILTITDETGGTATASGVVHAGVDVPVGDLITRSFWWSYGGASRSLQVAVPSDLYDWSQAQPRTGWTARDYDEYVLNTRDDALMAEIASALALGSYKQTVENALAFVQMAIAYVSDPSIFEYPKYPAETLVDEGGDCEDTAILYASLIRTLGHGALLVAVDTDGNGNTDHMVVFVPIDGTFPTCGMDCVWEYEGQIYAMAETAVDGGYLPLGQDPWGLDAGDIHETWNVSRVDTSPKMIKRLSRL